MDISTLRHSASHVMAQAVKMLFPKVKFGIGPAIDDGFYYDFDNVKFTPEDLKKIEQKMNEIIKKDLPFKKEIVTKEKAKKLFKDQPYKLELLKEMKDPITIYQQGDFIDLCAGPHINSSGQIKAFKLLNIAGAYWKGSEKNKMLQRIYGTAFPTQKELDEYVKKLEEIQKNDHRILGKELGLFVFSDLVGKGLPLLTPKGTTIRRELEKFVIDEELKRGYLHVITPDLARVKLYEISGHYPYYKNTMYPVMKVDEEKLILRPMTCPHHFMMYKSEVRSYKDLPLRIAELAHQYRYEKSGELSGLMRVRMFCLADAHIFAAVDQAKQVVKEVLDLIDYTNQIFGLIKGKDYVYRLSLGDRQDTKKYYKDNVAWDKAENVLREVLKEIKAPFYEAKNEAAFYGPKIDVQMKKVGNKEETAFTVQYDFVMPKRFDLKFMNKEGVEERPIVIHRSSIGAFERTMALLIEKYGGKFPLWLAPTQIILLTITDRNIEFTKKLKHEFEKYNLRVELNDKAETMSKKVRDAQLQKIPLILTIGDKEMENNTVSVRTSDGNTKFGIKIDDFIKKVVENIQKRSLTISF